MTIYIILNNRLVKEVAFLESGEKEESKARILGAAIQLFAEKGYDATRVSEIADNAGVNKALIYYYFKSKEDILDFLVNSLMNDFTTLSMDFIHECMVQMIEEGRLDILADRLHFTTEEDLQYFLDHGTFYYQKVLEYVLANRRIIRILMLESLKSSKHHDALFRFLDLMKESDGNPLYKTIWNVDHDIRYTKEMVLHKFLFSLLPVVNFAVYYEDYQRISGMNEQEMREAFLRSTQAISASFVSGKDVLMRFMGPIL